MGIKIIQKEVQNFECLKIYNCAATQVKNVFETKSCDKKHNL